MTQNLKILDSPALEVGGYKPGLEMKNLQKFTLETELLNPYLFLLRLKICEVCLCPSVPLDTRDALRVAFTWSLRLICLTAHQHSFGENLLPMLKSSAIKYVYFIRAMAGKMHSLPLLSLRMLIVGCPPYHHFGVLIL